MAPISVSPIQLKATSAQPSALQAFEAFGEPKAATLVGQGWDPHANSELVFGRPGNAWGWEHW